VTNDEWFGKRGKRVDRSVFSSASLTTSEAQSESSSFQSQTDYDVIVIGAGMGGLTVASQLAAKGQSVLLLEKYAK